MSVWKRIIVMWTKRLKVVRKELGTLGLGVSVGHTLEVLMKFNKSWSQGPGQ